MEHFYTRLMQSPALRATDSIGLEYSLGSSIFFLSPINVILKCSQCRGHSSKLTAEARVSQAVGLVEGRKGITSSGYAKAQIYVGP